MKTYTTDEVIELCRLAFQAGQTYQSAEEALNADNGPLTVEEFNKVLTEDEWIVDNIKY